MNLVKAPLKRLQAIDHHQLAGKEIDLDLLEEAGCFVVRDVIETSVVEKCLEHYQELQLRQHENPDAHPTEVRLHRPDNFSMLLEHPGVVSIASKIFDGSVGWDFIRLVRKDEAHPNPVFLHQDFCYQLGWGRQFSLFIALTPNHPENGGLHVHLGTHKLGYLGDAGELNRQALPEGLPVLKPILSSGDVLVMHSAAWHESGPNVDGTDRVYFELHLVPGENPYGQGAICGELNQPWKFEGSMIDRDHEQLFSNSRTQKLKYLYAERFNRN